MLLAISHISRLHIEVNLCWRSSKRQRFQACMCGAGSNQEALKVVVGNQGQWARVPIHEGVLWMSLFVLVIVTVCFRNLCASVRCTLECEEHV